jgi:hypothetical protein
LAIEVWATTAPSPPVPLCGYPVRRFRIDAAEPETDIIEGPHGVSIFLRKRGEPRLKWWICGGTVIHGVILPSKRRLFFVLGRFRI